VNMSPNLMLLLWISDDNEGLDSLISYINPFEQKNDQSDSTVAENSESSQKMLEMEWNIESSTLQLNGDE